MWLILAMTLNNDNLVTSTEAIPAMYKTESACLHAAYLNKRDWQLKYPNVYFECIKVQRK